LLDVAGVGYEVQIPLSTFYELSAQDGTRELAVSLHVHTHVREDALQLFGFSQPLERAMFEQLIAISGVGPRLALAILSGIGTVELEQAVEAQDRGRLEKIPGVGRKTAERLLLELRDRLVRMRAVDAAAVAPGRGPSAGASVPAGPRDDAVSALVNLGYKPDACRRAVDAALEELGTGAGLEDVLKLALARMVG
jgi:Holliday junction DNA helicase RuvA